MLLSCHALILLDTQLAELLLLQRWRGGKRPDLKRGAREHALNGSQQCQQPALAPPMNVPRLPPIQMTQQVPILAPRPPAAAAVHTARPPPPLVQAPLNATKTRNAPQQNEIPL